MNLQDEKEGWMPWFTSYEFMRDKSPYAWHQVEIIRMEWDSSQVVTVCEIHPAMNVAGLYWRPIRKGASEMPRKAKIELVVNRR